MSPLVAIVLAVGVIGFGVLIALCRAAALGDRVRIVPDDLEDWWAA